MHEQKFPLNGNESVRKPFSLIRVCRPLDKLNAISDTDNNSSWSYTVESYVVESFVGPVQSGSEPNCCSTCYGGYTTYNNLDSCSPNGSPSSNLYLLFASDVVYGNYTCGGSTSDYRTQKFKVSIKIGGSVVDSDTGCLSAYLGNECSRI